MILHGGGEAASALLRELYLGKVAIQRMAGGRAGPGSIGGIMAPLMALLSKPPQGCCEDRLRALVWAMDNMRALQETEGRSEGYFPSLRTSNFDSFVGSEGRGNDRPFAVDLWLRVLGYRHWVVVAFLHLLSPGGCASCKGLQYPQSHQQMGRHEPLHPAPDGTHLAPDELRLQSVPCHDKVLGALGAEGRGKEGEEEEGPARFLALFACPGLGQAEDRLAVMSELLAAAADLRKSGGSVREALRRAAPPGEDFCVRCFGAAMSAARVLLWAKRTAVSGTSPLSEGMGRALNEVLDPKVFSEVLEGDLSRDSGGVAVEGVEGGEGKERAGNAVGTRTREGLEGILSGLAAIEDIVWLCSLRLPLTHAHWGSERMEFLKCLEAWLLGWCVSQPSSGRRVRPACDSVLGHGSLSAAGKANPIPIPNPPACKNDDEITWSDLRVRRDGLVSSVRALLAGSDTMERTGTGIGL
ncbi:unnamed protein product [Discosporangium mesarthrocarpum]